MTSLPMCARLGSQYQAHPASYGVSRLYVQLDGCWLPPNRRTSIATLAYLARVVLVVACRLYIWVGLLPAFSVASSDTQGGGFQVSSTQFFQSCVQRVWCPYLQVLGSNPGQ